MPDLEKDDELFVRLYLDRHIIIRLALDLRGRGYDVLTTQEAQMDTASDEEQLTFAQRGPIPASVNKVWPSGSAQVAAFSTFRRLSLSFIRRVPMLEQGRQRRRCFWKWRITGWQYPWRRCAVGGHVGEMNPGVVLVCVK